MWWPPPPSAWHYRHLAAGSTAGEAGTGWPAGVHWTLSPREGGLVLLDAHGRPYAPGTRREPEAADLGRRATVELCTGLEWSARCDVLDRWADGLATLLEEMVEGLLRLRALRARGERPPDAAAAVSGFPPVVELFMRRYEDEATGGGDTDSDTPAVREDRHHRHLRRRDGTPTTSAVSPQTGTPSEPPA